MQLRRTGLYRLTRIVARMLPAAIVVLMAVPAWDYWHRADVVHHPSQEPEEFPQNLTVRADEFGLVVSKAGEDIFRVKTEVTLVTKDNHHIGQGVDIEILPRRAGDPIRHIRADECSIDRITSDIHCLRNITVRFDETTFGYTEQLTYIHATRTIASEVRTDLEQPGEMTGDAGRMTYSTETGLLHLYDRVNIYLTSGATLRSGLAAFHKAENWATVSQGVELLSPNGNIQGANGRAELEPGTYRPRVITVDGGVSVASGKAAEAKKGESWTIRSERLRGDLSHDSRIEHVFAQGRAEARRKTAAGEEVLTGGEIEAFMDADEELSLVEARVTPEFTPKFVSAGRLLTAETRIVIDPAGTVTTTGASVLDGGNGTVIHGTDFSIEQRQNSRLFATNLRAVLTTSELRTEGERTTAEFDGESNQLREFAQTGEVIFKQGVRSGYARSMRVTESGNNIRFEGAASVIDLGTETTMNAETITLDQKRKSVEGTGNVVVTDNRSGEVPIRVTSGRVWAEGDTVEYRDRVRLYRGAANIDADHLTANTASNGFHAEGNVVFVASGGFDARSQSLDFDGASEQGQSAIFRGNVRANRRDKNGVLVLNTATMHVRLKPGSEAALESIEARGGVTVRQGSSTGEGVEADYSAATGEIVLRGSDKADAVARGPDGETRGFLIQTNPDGRWASVQPSRITGSVKTSTDKQKK